MLSLIEARDQAKAQLEAHELAVTTGEIEPDNAKYGKLVSRYYALREATEYFGEVTN